MIRKTEKPKLKMSKTNAKLQGQAITVSLPSGFTCPGAMDCLSKADRVTGRIKDGKHTKFRCFSATQEAVFKNVRTSRWENLDMLKAAKTKAGMVALIERSIPNKRPKRIRIHVGGDMFSQDYLDAWIEVAQRNEDITFYAYTKSLDKWAKRLLDIPHNMILTASAGGKYDHMIERLGLKQAVVVYHPDEAKRLGLEIDHDDSHAYSGGDSFALLIHGVQPKGSEASTALRRLNQENIEYAYSKRKIEPIVKERAGEGFEVRLAGGGKVTVSTEV